MSYILNRLYLQAAVLYKYLWPWYDLNIIMKDVINNNNKQKLTCWFAMLYEEEDMGGSLWLALSET